MTSNRLETIDGYVHGADCDGCGEFTGTDGLDLINGKLLCEGCRE